MMKLFTKILFKKDADINEDLADKLLSDKINLALSKPIWKYRNLILLPWPGNLVLLIQE